MSNRTQEKTESLRRRLSRSRFTLVAIVVAFLSSLSIIPDDTVQRASADTPVGQRIRGVRKGHLVSDPVADRPDYIFQLTSGSGGGSTISAYAPGGTLLFTIPPDPIQPIRHFIDAIDLDDDGSVEFIGAFQGNTTTPPALWIYNGNGSLRKKLVLPLGLTMTAEHIKIYDVLPTKQKRIVIAPDTAFNVFSGNQVSVYFLNSSGQVIASPTVSKLPEGDLLGFPSVLVDDIDGNGINEIFVIAKARILAFNQNGQKLYYKRIPFPDCPVPNCSLVWEGRRYGIYKLADTDGNGDYELVVAADANNINNNIAGAVYEAYNVSASPESPDNAPITHMWRRWLDRSSHGYSDAIPNNPFDYKIGVPLRGITDINNDGILDIVVTETDASAGLPFVRVINARTGVPSFGPFISGICIDVRQLDTSTNLKDLIVYDPLTINPATGIGTYKVWRFQQGTYTPFQLPESPAGTLSQGAAEILTEDIPDTISLSENGTLPIGVNTAIGHHSTMVSRANSIRAFVGYTSRNCPAGLASWTTQGGVVKRSLDIPVRPGQVVHTLDVTDKQNYTWIFNLESPCGTLTNSVRTTVQAGNILGQPRDFLDVPAVDPYREYILTIAERNVTLGCDAQNYCPSLVVTRGQMAAFIIRALGEHNPPMPAQQRFADVPPSNPFYAFIEQMAVRGITAGCDAQNYCPDQPVTRAQIAKFLESALGNTNPPQPAQQRFVDVPPSHFAYAYIESFIQRGLLRGILDVIELNCDPNGLNFCPEQEITREEMAAFLTIGFKFDRAL